MVDERESPSAGWRAVYREMEADPDVEEPTRPCPDCDRTCENVLRDVYECEEHGVFRASADHDDESLETTTDETDVTDAEETVTDDTEQTTAADPEEDDAGDALDDHDEVKNRASEPAD